MTDLSVAAADGKPAATALEPAARAGADEPAAGDPTLWGPAAQPAGDRQALAQRGRALLHLHLTDRAAGLGQLLGAIP